MSHIMDRKAGSDCFAVAGFDGSDCMIRNRQIQMYISFICELKYGKIELSLWVATICFSSFDKEDTA